MCPIGIDLRPGLVPGDVVIVAADGQRRQRRAVVVEEAVPQRPDRVVVAMLAPAQAAVVREDDLRAARLSPEHAAKPSRPLRIAHRPVLVVARDRYPRTPGASRRCPSHARSARRPACVAIDRLLRFRRRETAPKALVADRYPVRETARWMECPSRDCRPFRRRPSRRRPAARRRARTPPASPLRRRRRHRRSGSAAACESSGRGPGASCDRCLPPSANQKMLAISPPPFAAPASNTVPAWPGFSPQRARRSDDDGRAGHLALFDQLPRIVNQVIGGRELMRDQGHRPVVVFERHLPEAGVVLTDVQSRHVIPPACSSAMKRDSPAGPSGALDGPVSEYCATEQGEKGVHVARGSGRGRAALTAARRAARRSPCAAPPRPTGCSRSAPAPTSSSSRRRRGSAPD